MVIRTQKHVTITKAHPYHEYVSDERHCGGNAIVKEWYNHNCPLCRDKTGFTEAELLSAAFVTYGAAISVEFLQDAMQENTLGEAVEILLVDSTYWDGNF